MDFFYYIFAGFVVGLLVGLTGVGGGSLMTPILMIFFNVKAVVAVGTDLLYASITKTVANAKCTLCTGQSSFSEFPKKRNSLER